MGINCPPVKASSTTKVDPKKAVGSAKAPKKVGVSTKGTPKVSTSKPKSGSGEKKSGSGGKHQVVSIMIHVWRRSDEFTVTVVVVDRQLLFSLADRHLLLFASSIIFSHSLQNDHHNANGGSSKGGNGGSANGGSADCSTGASLVGLSALNFNSCNGGAGGNASGGASVGGKGGDTLNSLTERDGLTSDHNLEHTSQTSPMLMTRAEAIADAKKKKTPAPKKPTTPKKKSKNILEALGLGTKDLGPLLKRDDAPSTGEGDSSSSSDEVPKESQDPKAYEPKEPSAKMPKGMKKPKEPKGTKGYGKGLHVARDTGVDAYGTKAETNDLEMEKRILTNMNDYDTVIKSRADPESAGKGGNAVSILAVDLFQKLHRRSFSFLTFFSSHFFPFIFS